MSHSATSTVSAIKSSVQRSVWEIDDLPDARWRDYFDDGMSPHEAIECAYERLWSDHFPRGSSNIERATRVALFFIPGPQKNLRTQVFIERSAAPRPGAAPGYDKGRRPQAADLTFY